MLLQCLSESRPVSSRCFLPPDELSSQGCQFTPETDRCPRVESFLIQILEMSRLYAVIHSTHAERPDGRAHMCYVSWIEQLDRCWNGMVSREWVTGFRISTPILLHLFRSVTDLRPWAGRTAELSLPFSQILTMLVKLILKIIRRLGEIFNPPGNHFSRAKDTLRAEHLFYDIF